MPEIDLTITVTVVIAVCAIISPVITTLLNNHHLYKMKKLDMKLESQKNSYFYKRGIYEEYLKSASKSITLTSNENMSDYGEAYMLALVYFPEDLQKDLISINDFICRYERDEARALLNKLAPKIRTILKTM